MGSFFFFLRCSFDHPLFGRCVLRAWCCVLAGVQQQPPRRRAAAAGLPQSDRQYSSTQATTAASNNHRVAKVAVPCSRALHKRQRPTARPLTGSPMRLSNIAHLQQSAQTEGGPPSPASGAGRGHWGLTADFRTRACDRKTLCTARAASVPLAVQCLEPCPGCR